MKTKTIFLMLLSFLSLGMLRAQDRTTVTATSNDISDNLDLKAVASVFGDARDLEDFERRLNDPKAQISNLDLNGDGYVDYLRVIETTEDNLHLIVVQAVLEKDVFQDVATIDVERNGDNVSVQVVGDVYMYGPNYIYEPVYVTRPVIYNFFWGSYYRPYYSPWYWGYYPTYYTYWAPYPIYRYRTHIHQHINVHNHYNYVNVRNNPRAIRLYDGRRQNGYERNNPGRSFTERTQSGNKHDYDIVRHTDTRSGVRTGGLMGGTRGTTTGGTRANTTTGTRIKNNPGSDGSIRQVDNSGNGKVKENVRTTTPATGTEGTRTIQNTAGTKASTASGRVESGQPIRKSTEAPAPQRIETTSRSTSSRSQAPAVQQAPQRQQPARSQNSGTSRSNDRRSRG